MVKLVIIADDLTGALDTGVQFAKCAVPTLITTKVDMEFGKLDDTIQVVVVDTESRHLSGKCASKLVKQVVIYAKSCGVDYFYKKTDSTLRGNIGAELVAVMSSCGSNEIMFIPAFPKTGRTTMGGQQYVNGISLDKTAFAKDPLNPIKSGSLAGIIKDQCEVEVKIISKNERPDFFQSSTALSEIIYVFDAQVDQDLMNIGNMLKEENKLKVTAGCAGFAEILLKLITFSKTSLVKPSYHRNTLVVCGSVNDLSIEQIKEAEKNSTMSLLLTPEVLLKKDYINTQEGRQLIQQIVKCIKSGNPLILKTIDQKEDIPDYIEYGMKNGLTKELVHLNIAKNLGMLIKEILCDIEVGNLVVFGGDIALGIIEALDVQGVIAMEEMLPGIAVSHFHWAQSSMRFITKAGGFGEKDVLNKILEDLKGRG